MAVVEQKVLLTSKDAEGNKNLLYPVTTLDCVEGAEDLVKEYDLPNALPNPKKLTLTGAASATYDGSSDVTVDIPAIAGEPGKTAFAYAQEAGYTGTEAEFAAKLAEEYPPPDWQAAEGEPGHILNRTHWRDVTETVLFEQTITVANNQFLDASGVSIPLNAGETYTVVWDGVSYKTVAKDMVYNGFDAVAVGNGAFTGAEDTGEPFLILTLEGAGYGVVCLTDGEHTFTVSGNEYTYHTIPPEYLAGSKPFYIDLKTDGDYGPILYETDITKHEVTNALAKGYQIVVRRKLPRYNLYDYFFMDHQTNGEWLYFYRIFYENRPRCEILEFRDNESGGYDITHSRYEIVNPTALKNPYALTINGTSYDGSQAVNIESIKGDKGDKGDTGQRGTGLLAVTTAPSSYTTAVGDITPKYRMAISTIKTQSGATEVLLGDTVRYSYYHYPIAYLDASYAYFTTRVSIRGATGSTGKTAYAYAQDGGYTGTEAEFAEKLASEQNGLSVVTTAGDGAAYTATVEGIDALTVGATFIMIPHTVSTNVLPSLNVNNLGAKKIRRRVSNSTVTTVASVSANWLGANKPIMVTYDGTYWIADLDRPNAADIYGTVPVENGGVPTSTTDDEGKFLRVVDGKAAWVALTNAEEVAF